MSAESPVLRWDERAVGLEELRSALASPMDPEELFSLVRWSTRRYGGLPAGMDRRPDRCSSPRAGPNDGRA